MDIRTFHHSDDDMCQDGVHLLRDVNRLNTPEITCMEGPGDTPKYGVLRGDETHRHHDADGVITNPVKGAWGYIMRWCASRHAHDDDGEDTITPPICKGSEKGPGGSLRGIPGTPSERVFAHNRCKSSRGLLSGDTPSLYFPTILDEEV